MTRSRPTLVWAAVQQFLAVEVLACVVYETLARDVRMTLTFFQGKTFGAAICLLASERVRDFLFAFVPFAGSLRMTTPSNARKTACFKLIGENHPLLGLLLLCGSLCSLFE